MKFWLILVALAAFCVAPPAFAQDQATVVASCGSITIQAGGQHFRTIDTNGVTCSSGGASGHSAQAEAYLARTVGGNEGGNGANIATLIDGLVSDGVWAKLDALYVLAQQNETDALLNLVGTSYPLVDNALLRATAFTSYKGFGPFGPSGLNTGLLTTDSELKYTLNNASIGIWSYAVVVEDVNVIVNVYSSTALYPHLASAPGGFGGRVNGSVGAFVPTTITKGLSVGERSDPANIYMYQNGVPSSAQASASEGLNGTNPILIGNGSAAVFSAAFIGASLGAAGQLALYNRLRTYMTAVGVP